MKAVKPSDVSALLSEGNETQHAFSTGPAGIKPSPKSKCTNYGHKGHTANCY